VTDRLEDIKAALAEAIAEAHGNAHDVGPCLSAADGRWLIAEVERLRTTLGHVEGQAKAAEEALHAQSKMLERLAALLEAHA
jgi:hypothetical protein